MPNYDDLFTGQPAQQEEKPFDMLTRLLVSVSACMILLRRNRSRMPMSRVMRCMAKWC